MSEDKKVSLRFLHEMIRAVSISFHSLQYSHSIDMISDMLHIFNKFKRPL
jgi:hypothetical protein